MLTGFKSSGQKTTDGVNLLATTASGPVKYVAPAPPAETPAHAHRYVQLLFETSDNFNVSQTQIGQTLGFDLSAFIQKAGLSTPIRANYFNVTG
jgi:hypothetical protein